MRLSGCCLLLVVAGTTSACAAVAGLDNYQSSRDSTTTGDASADAFAMGMGDDAWADDTGSPDGSSDAPEASLDMGDAPPVCSPSNCALCCRDGVCVGGSSVNSCGINGAACADCTDNGGACTNGACTTKVADAAPPPACIATNCKGCAPVWETGCCKSDGTCGCAMGFGSGPCN